MLRILIILFLAIALVVGGAYLTLNTTLVTQRLILQQFPKVSNACGVQSLKLSSQKFDFPDEIVWDDVQAVLKCSDQQIEIDIKRLTLKGLANIFFGQKNLTLDIEEMMLKSPQAVLNNIYISAQIISKGSQSVFIAGGVRCLTAQWGDYAVKNITAKISGDERQIQFKDFAAQAYQARLEGEISLEYKPRLAYSIQMKLSDLDLVQLEQVSPVIVSQFQGKVYGTVKLKGNQEDLEFFQAEGDIEEGGRIKAALLGFVTQYIPRSQERQQLELLLKEDDMVVVELISVRLKSVTSHKISGLMKISSEQLNLDLNFPITINLDGKITSLFKYWNDFIAVK